MWEMGGKCVWRGNFKLHGWPSVSPLSACVVVQWAQRSGVVWERRRVELRYTVFTGCYVLVC